MTRSSPRTPRGSGILTTPGNTAVGTRNSPRRQLDLASRTNAVAGKKQGVKRKSQHGKQQTGTTHNVVQKQIVPKEPNLRRGGVKQGAKVAAPQSVVKKLGRKKVPALEELLPSDGEHSDDMVDGESDGEDEVALAIRERDVEQNCDNEDANNDDDDANDDVGEEMDDEGEWEKQEDDDSSDDEEIETGYRRRRGRGPKASFSQRKYRQYLENMNSDRAGDNQTRTGLDESTACQTTKDSATPLSYAEVNFDRALLHVYTRKESLRNREKHVATRVSSYVKNSLFRNIKFVNSERMIQRAMKLVMQFENVREDKQFDFHMLYESVFNEALNTKRSACEQAGGKIVMETLATLQTADTDFFTIDELCKLRRSTTERERQAYYWFFGTFIECVCGKKAWGKAKFIHLISRAKVNNATTERIVTVSDEAFALLLIENYIEKWTAAYEATKEQVNEVEYDARGRKKAAQRRRGKYTGATAKTGHCKFGGWTKEGMVRFNELYNMVLEDRASPQAEKMERELLAFCTETKSGIDGGVSGAPEEGEGAAGLPENDAPVEAMWDIDVMQL